MTKKNIPWTQFWDMHSGGGLKESPYSHIYIQAPEAEATVIFYNRFGHSPHRVSCTCCGSDYSITEAKTLKEASAYQRACPVYNSPKKKNGFRESRYFEKGEKIPKGWTKGMFSTFNSYVTVEEYAKHKNVLVISDDDISDSERVGSVPAQGYVWMD